MQYWKRIHYSETQKALMCDRWQRGESLQQITDLFDRHHSAIAGVLARSGGIRPPRRQRAQRALRLAEREEISRGVVAGQSSMNMLVAYYKGRGLSAFAVVADARHSASSGGRAVRLVPYGHLGADYVVQGRSDAGVTLSDLITMCASGLRRLAGLWF